MGKLTRHQSSREVAAKADGNPEGKGLNGFLFDWYGTEPRGVVIKPQRQVLAEFFTSMLILSAKFKHRPAIGTPNYLYFVDGDWSLSLIAPDEWSEERRAGFVGTCHLQRDMTWTIKPADTLAGNEEIAAAIARFYDAFAETLDSDLTIEEILPFYAGKMPYYQRLYASAMSRSVRATATLGGLSSTRCRDWRLHLPNKETVLLPSDG